MFTVWMQLLIKLKINPRTSADKMDKIMVWKILDDGTRAINLDNFIQFWLDYSDSDNEVFIMGRTEVDKQEILILGPYDSLQEAVRIMKELIK